MAVLLVFALSFPRRGPCQRQRRSAPRRRQGWTQI